MIITPSARSEPGASRSTAHGWQRGARPASLRGEQRREALAAYLLILPTFLGFFVFVAGPLLASIGLSFAHYDVLNPPSLAGLDNYRHVLDDQKVVSSFRNTGVFVILSTLFEIVLALLLAVGVQRRMPAVLRYVFRTAYFLPIITSGAAMGIVFSYLFNKDFGVINYYLGFLGVVRIPWITSTAWSLFTIVLASTWQRLGFTFLLFSAGLQNIPREIYEAADLDGATGWARLWRITIPLLSPTILFTAVIGIISGLQVFDLPTIITGGGPGDSSRTVVMVIHEVGFRNLQFGYGSAIAVILFCLIMALTIVQFRLSSRWVHYR